MKNIVLTGMPGAGKSTLGVLLAKALGMDFVDTDIVIQQHEKRLLQDIIDKDGIEAFLKTEEDAVCSLRCENTVIATGGSVVYSEKAVNSLKKSGITVYIHVDYNEIKNRITDITTRGIVLKNGENLRQAYDERRPLYEKCGDFTVDCTGKTVEDSVSEIIASLKGKL